MLGTPGLAFEKEQTAAATQVETTTTNEEGQTAAAVTQEEEVVLRRTPLIFVDSVWELWGALLAGVPYVGLFFVYSIFIVI
jgi:hypothetical protein